MIDDDELEIPEKSKFMKAHYAVGDARDVLDSCEEKRDAIVREVLKGLEFKIERIGIESVSIHGSKVHVSYGWSSRGLRDSDGIDLPLYLFEAEDPFSAAQEYRRQEKEQEQAQIRAKKEAQLKQLQAELKA